MTQDTDAPVLELRDVSKSFGAVVALRSGTLAVSRGSIHALVGENGAGKSTLVKIAAGVHRRDGGTFRLDGEDVDFGSTADSKAAGIAVIYQEPTLFPDLSVTENIFMGRQLLKRGRRIDKPAMYAEAERLFRGLGVRIDPRRPALGLSIADQQIIEIAKAISLDAKVLVMDEPTAALSGVEVDRLFAVARRLRDEGRAIVFISHRFKDWTSKASQVIGSSGIPSVMIVFAVLAVVFILLLHFTPFGRGVYDIGLSSEAATFSGVSAKRTKLVLFVLTGVVSALAGIYFTLRYGSARGDNATGLELQVIAAVLLGGVSIFGGRGRLPGVIAGVLLIGVISSALRLQGVTVNVISIIIGLLLVLSVISTPVLARLSDAAARRSRAKRSSAGPQTVVSQ